MEELHADVVLVGGGSAGCVLAARLSEDPARRVVLIEAGTRITDPDVDRPELWPFIQNRNYDWAYRTTPQTGTAGRVHEWPRGRGVGGSSNLHAMAHMRGDRRDFARWAAETGDQRWSWEGLLPAFRKLETADRADGATADADWDAVHGSDGPLPVLRPTGESSPLVVDYLAAWQGLGVPGIPDHNHGDMVGATPNSLTIRDGRRVTASEAYLDPALGRPNLTLLDGAQVHRLVLDGSRVAGVAVTRDGRDLLVRGDAVILTAGSIGDPLLLMRSGIGDPAVLAAAGVGTTLASAGVGGNLHDHLLGAGNLYRARREVPPTRLQLSEAMTYLPADGPAAIAADRSSGPGPDVVIGCVVGPSASEVLAPRLPAIPAGGAYTLLFGVTNPTSRGSLRITGPDLDDAPVIEPAYLTTAHDRETFRRALELAREVGAAPELADWRAEEILPGPGVRSVDELDAFIAEAVITHHHPVGTLRMGADESAPVDAALRFRGLDNLWVVDGSVIPSITAGPVHAAVLAIAESFAESFAESSDPAR
ncbi:GMC family oxidoreductase [Schumannella soli]|uniref:FAD-binding protein n=1 Tax=Schumannella soli TaxID=2590779 RepID=A0A506Y495_9MICO|nr:GMC family oxidoreductase N-terminal domain-containing protein [Schumannella soli]TPW77416.1 FAD-binding protein [Schumannella soli]